MSVEENHNSIDGVNSDDAMKAAEAEQSQGHGQGSTKPLGAKLVEKGLISNDQLEVAIREQQNAVDNRQMLGAVLVELGFITESALAEVLTETSGVQHFDLKSAVLDPKLIVTIPKEIAERHKVIPVSIEGETVTLATSDVYNILAIDQVHKYFPTNYKIIPVYSSETDIAEVLEQYYEYDMSIQGILKEIESSKTDVNEQATAASGYVNPTVRLVDALLIDAIKKEASDIHFEPEGCFLRLRYRIDGQMVQVSSFHKEYWSAIIVRIKIMSGMNIAETRLPQDGRISYNVLGREIDFRVATQPTIHGENVVMRILDKKKALVPLENLGYSPKNVKLLKRLLKRPEGIVIVTGPTGSGKPTTLYSILNYINDISQNIMTLEDPVEYQLPMIRQTQVREGSGMDFVSGIKSLMRQDPDIIFVGEVRDEATANMAIRAAMTGHQVYSTLHTNDALGVIPRLVDIGIPNHLLSGSLIALVAQRLSKKLCEACKEPYTATKEECELLGIDADEPPTIYRHVGCPECDSKGYKGRVALGEIVPIDRNIDELIAVGATRKKMMEYTVENTEFVPMIEDGCQKVLAGLIDIEELIRTVDMTSRIK
ncbi:MAG: Flp pilus assembly complex ATPase component TadA [Rickettsiales bacterium]|nr:Flp pilus assembly complex ATPase component TadA [Rickettsiales bacterium]